MAKTQTLYFNNARATLATAVTTGSASFQVSTTAPFTSSLSSGQSFYVTLFDNVNIEIVQVVAVSGTTFTVLRGQDGTTPMAFASATTVVGNRLIAANLRNFATIDAKLGDLSTLDQISGPPSTMNGNSYLVQEQGGDNNPVMVTADTISDIWAFPNYAAKIYGTNVTAGATTTTINLPQANTKLTDSSPQAYIMQFIVGTQKGQCRFISSIGSSSFTVGTAFSSAPLSTDTYRVYQFQGNNLESNLVQIGQWLDPAYVTQFNYPVDGTKRISGGDIQMSTGGTFSNIALNYIPTGTAPARGTYPITGTHGGFTGFAFTSSYNLQNFLLSDASSGLRSSGVYSTSQATWDWRWDNGVLAAGTIPWAQITGVPAYALLNSPAFTGAPTAPTQALGNSTTLLATTAFVQNAFTDLYNHAHGTNPGSLNFGGLVINWATYYLGDDTSGNYTSTFTFDTPVTTILNVQVSTGLDTGTSQPDAMGHKVISWDKVSSTKYTGVTVTSSQIDSSHVQNATIHVLCIGVL